MSPRFFSRREFIWSAVSAAGAASAYGLWRHWGRGPRARIVGALNIGDKKSFAIGVIDLSEGKVREVPAPFLGHGFTQNPQNPARVIMFPHDSTNTACEFDVETLTVVRTFESAGGRHFYGHGTYSPDGTLLYAAENNYAKKESVIAVRDAVTLEFKGEFPSYGIDPHEMLFLKDGRTVAIANGGLLTDPRIDGGNKALAPVDSSLVFVDFKSQKLIHKIKVENPGLSFRHLARLPGDEVAIAIQDKAWGALPGTLLYFSQDQKSVKPVEFTPELRTRANHHSLSVAAIGGTRVVLTSPNGNLLTLWDARSGKRLAEQTIERCSGVATTGADTDPLLVSSHSGKLSLVDSLSLKVLKEIPVGRDDVHWGAHLCRLI